MKLTQLDIESLDRYLRNEMEVQEKEAFEHRLESEALLKEELAQLRLMQDGLRLDDLQQKKQMLEKWDDEIEEDKKTNLFGIGWKWSVAATILLIVTAWLIWPKPHALEQKLFASYFEPLEMDESGVRSGNEDPNLVRSDNFEFGTNNYIIGSYDRAAPALLKVYEEEKDTLMLLYAGIALLANGDADKALKTFDNIKVWPEDLEDDLIWYRTMALLEKGELDKVSSAFSDYKGMLGSYELRAKELLEELNLN